jgi:hypothetical protein
MLALILAVFTSFAPLKASPHLTKPTTMISKAAFFAQVDPTTAIKTFETLLIRLCLLIGIAVVAYSGFMIAHQGRTIEGIVGIIGGFIIAMAGAIITYLGGLGGVQ